MMHKASVAGEYDEEITRLAESIAGSIGCSLEQLYNQPLKASQRQYIEPTDVDEARTLLFSPP
jgi:hypothetical protein